MPQPPPIRPTPPVPTLSAPGCTLRPWRSDDTPAVFVPTPGAFAWAVCDEHSGEIRASISLNVRAGTPAIAELSFGCAAGAREQELVSTAARSVCGWAFPSLGLARIEWYAEVGDETSWRVAHQVGFTFEGGARGRLRGDRGQLVDAWTGAVLAGEVTSERVPLPWGPDPNLTAGTVCIRRWRGTDIPAFARLQSEADVLFWSGRHPDNPVTEDEARRQINEGFVERWMTGSGAIFAIVVEGDIAGGVALARRHQRLGEISWWLGHHYRGRGAATTAVYLLVHWATTLGLERIEARVHVDNLDSQRVAERVGMRREGTLASDAPYLRTYELRSTSGEPRPITSAAWGDAYLYGVMTGDLSSAPNLTNIR